MSTNTYGGTYDSGAISIAHDSTALTGAGTIWATVQIEQGDILLCDGSFAYIEEIIDNTHATLGMPWPGDTQSGADYVILKTSWNRYEPALTQQKVRELIAHYTGLGVIIGIEGDEPDPDLGYDGNFGLKVNDGAWFLWEKVDGIWVERGTPVGVTNKSLWVATAPEGNYVTNDIVSRLGILYIAKKAGVNKPPEANSSPSDPNRYWDILLQGGSLYDLMFDASDRPGSGERFRKAVFNRTVMIPATMAESVAQADTAATATAVFSIKKCLKNSDTYVQFATITFAASSSEGVFACAADVSFVKGDSLIIEAPNPRDATLADIAITISLYR